MTLVAFSPAPKRTEKLDALERWTQKQEAKRAKVWSRKPVQRSALKRGSKPIPKVNARRQARKDKAYRAHLASAFWKTLRQQAYHRDGGFCQCPDCIRARKDGEAFGFEPIDIWLDTKGVIHGFDTHHTTYARFGKELLSDVLTMKPAHHRRLEALTGLRRTFLRGTR